MRRAGPPRSPHLGICHVFYETRVLMGRDVTLQHFAREVLGGEVEAYQEVARRLGLLPEGLDTTVLDLDTHRKKREKE